MGSGAQRGFIRFNLRNLSLSRRGSLLLIYIWYIFVLVRFDTQTAALFASVFLCLSWRDPVAVVIVELALCWSTSQLGVIRFYEHNHLFWVWDDISALISPFTGSETRAVRSLVLAVWYIMALTDYKGCAKQLYPFGAGLMAVCVVHMNNGSLCLIFFFFFERRYHAAISVAVQLI